MKRLPLLLVCALALLGNACEMHKASELEDAPHHDQAHAEQKAGTTADQPEKAKSEEKKAGEAAPGEAPKFFPEKK